MHIPNQEDHKIGFIEKVFVRINGSHTKMKEVECVHHVVCVEMHDHQQENQLPHQNKGKEIGTNS